MDDLHVVSWPSPAQIIQMDIYQVRRNKPKQTLVELEKHKKTDDPTDLEITTAPDGTKLVTVGSDGIWKKEESNIHQTVMSF